MWYEYGLAAFGVVFGVMLALVLVGLLAKILKGFFPSKTDPDTMQVPMDSDIDDFADEHGLSEAERKAIGLFISHWFADQHRGDD